MRTREERLRAAYWVLDRRYGEEIDRTNHRMGKFYVVSAIGEAMRRIESLLGVSWLDMMREKVNRA